MKLFDYILIIVASASLYFAIRYWNKYTQIVDFYDNTDGDGYINLVGTEDYAKGR